MNINLTNIYLVFSYVYCCYYYCNASLLNKQQQSYVYDNNVESITTNVNNHKKPWELLEAIKATQQLKKFNGTWLNDEEFYYITPERIIHKYIVVTGTDEILIEDFLEMYDTFVSMDFSSDNTKILVRYDSKPIFRHSSLSKYDIYDIKTKKSIRLRGGRRLQYCSWSPRMNRLSYVYENNVYIYLDDDGGFDIQITTDGVANVVYNGVADWVYEEEVLSNTNAMWWSPDGKKLAVGMYDDTNVHTFTYFKYGDADENGYQYPKEIDLKYPKSGSNNPKVAVKVIDTSEHYEELKSVIINAPTDIVSNDHILQYVTWANENELLIVWLNRRQNITTMQLCNVNGKCHEVTRLIENNGWIVFNNDLLCLKFSRNCLFSYWIDNWYQVWKLNLENGTNLWHSRGNFTVLKIYGYNEIDDILYYQATLPYNSTNYQVFANDKCLSCSEVDQDGAVCSSAEASFSKKFSYYSLTCTGPNPTYTKLFKTSTNRFIKNWELNNKFRFKLSMKQRPIVHYMNVSLADETEVIVKLQLPPNLDEQRKYPLIVFVYGGPNSVKVTSAFTVGFEGYLTTKREIIYAQIDGRGTGNKGKHLLFSVNNHLGEYEVQDQLHVTKYLREALPYVDESRIGIWGWSYGGYMTARTISYDHERIFKCGVSVAPVTSWLYYDSIYTERYMGLPTFDDNYSHYMSSSVFNDLSNFRTHDFLLIHGTADDNVHYQQSLLFAKVLQQNDILFDEMTYTDENHAIGNLLPHLYNTIDNFWMKCFNLSATDEW